MLEAGWRHARHAALGMMVLAATTRAEAQMATGLRVGLTTVLVAPGETTLVDRDTGSRFSLRDASYGLGAPHVGIDLAGVVTPVVFGAEGAITVHETSAPLGAGVTSTQSVFEYGVLLYGEGRISLLDAFAVQLRGGLGAHGTNTSTGSDRTSALAFVLRAQVGAHIHPIPELSFTPHLSVAYLTGSSASSARENGLEGWEVTIGVTLFGWITLGAVEPEAEPAEEVAPEATVAVTVPEPTPAPAAPEALRTEDGWQLRSLALGGWGDATVWLHPVTGAARIAIPIALPRDTALTFCSSARIGAETARVLTASAADGVVMATSRAGLEALLAEGRLQLCGQSFVLTEDGRASLTSLLGASP